MAMRLPRWSRFGLRTKGLIVVALPVLPLGFFWLILAVAATRQAPPANTASRGLQIQVGLARLLSSLVDAEAAARDFIDDGKPEALERFRGATRLLPDIQGQLDRVIIDETLRASLATAENRIARGVGGLVRLVDGAATGVRTPDTAALLEESVSLIGEARKEFAGIEEREATLVAERTERSQRMTRGFLWILLGGSVVCTAGGALAALVLVRGITSRVRRLTHDADRLARGESLYPPQDASDDEIARLGVRLHEAGRQLRAHESELVRATRSLDSFFNLSDDFFCIAGFDGIFTRVNPAWTRTFGYTAEELCSQPFLDLVHPDDRERTAAEAAALGTGATTVSFANRYRTADGGYRWLLWHARAAVDEQLIYASARDVTDEREAMRRLDEFNETLRQQTAELETTNRELEAFCYSVSHDLRAPLRAIDGFSQVIEEDQGDRLDDSGRKALRRVRAAATRMGTLIDELLKLSRLTRADLYRQPVDLSGVASSIVTELRRRDEARPVSIDIAPSLTASADAYLVRILLQNLLDNAWKYTGKTTSAAIEFGRRANGATPVYYVRDNGAGFDMAYADKLFGAFQRLHADREFEGTGIGLATVQRIVHRHGGRVWATSAVGAGATFEFTLEPEHGEVA